MSVVYISEFASVAQATGRGAGVVNIVPMPPLAEQDPAFGTASKPFGASTRIIRVNVDAICSIRITRPEAIPASGALAATTAQLRMPANQTEYFEVIPGSVLTAISNS